MGAATRPWCYRSRRRNLGTQRDLVTPAPAFTGEGIKPGSVRWVTLTLPPGRYESVWATSTTTRQRNAPGIRRPPTTDASAHSALSRSAHRHMRKSAQRHVSARLPSGIVTVMWPITADLGLRRTTARVLVTRYRECPEAVMKKRGRSSTLEAARNHLKHRSIHANLKHPFSSPVRSRSRLAAQGSRRDRGSGPCDRPWKRAQEGAGRRHPEPARAGAWRRRLSPLARSSPTAPVESMYSFAADAKGVSNCSGSCAKLLAAGAGDRIRPKGPQGVTAKLGSADPRRRDEAADRRWHADVHLRRR